MLRLRPIVCSDIAGPRLYEARPMRLEEPLKAKARGYSAPLRAFYQTQDDQQDHRADEGIDDFTNEPRSDRKPDDRQQITGNQAADDADDDVADQSEAATLHDHTGKPTGNRADDQPNNNAHSTPLVSPSRQRPVTDAAFSSTAAPSNHRMSRFRCQAPRLHYAVSQK